MTQNIINEELNEYNSGNCIKARYSSNIWMYSLSLATTFNSRINCSLVSDRLMLKAVYLLYYFMFDIPYMVY